MTAPRIKYLDNLRAIATLLLIPYHAARIFDRFDYYITAESWIGFDVFCSFINVWFMPLFFLIAGASASFSLRKRSYSEFGWERFNRLIIPGVVGVLLLLPVNGYFAYLNHHDVSLGWFQYLPHFFKAESYYISGFDGGFTLGHLWFLLYLMIFSLLAIPFKQALDPSTLRRQDNAKGQNNAKLLLKYFGVIVGVPLLLMGAQLTGIPYPNPVYFICFYGVGLFLYDRNTNAAFFFRCAPIMWVLGMMTMPIVLFMFLMRSEGLETIGYEGLCAFNAYFWAIALLDLGRKFLSQSHPVLHWVNVHGLVLYILHLPIITVVGYGILLWIKAPVLAWSLITLLSTLLTLVMGGAIAFCTTLRLRL